MREIVHELVDRFVDHGECEFMAEFADHYPPRVMFEMLGLPEDEHAQFLEWSKDLTLVLGLTVAQDLERIETSLLALYECVDRHCADRRRQPGEDILSALVAAEQDGDRLRRQELRSMVVVIAGQDSTRNQLGLALHTFTQYPEQWALLAERPELAERAVEEVMRVDSTIPLGGVSRWRTSHSLPPGSTSPRIGRHSSASAAGCTTAWARCSHAGRCVRRCRSSLPGSARSS
jgi:cytochrome P450